MKYLMLSLLCTVSLQLLMESRAEAARAPKVVRSRGCEVRIRGGEFSTGDEAVFSFYRRGRNVPVVIKIVENRGEGRFIGQVMEPAKCDKVQGARFSKQSTDTYLRDLYLYRQWAGIGYMNLSHQGMNVIGGKAGQSLPSMIVAQTKLEFFPLASMRPGFFEQNVGFTGEFSSSLPVLGNWELEDGGVIEATSMSYSLGILARFYLIGPAHPSTVVAKFRSSSQTFETIKTVTYTKSLLRSLECAGPMLSAEQLITVTSSMQLFGGVYGALGSSCSTPGISEAESLDFERQQLAAGVAREDVLISTEIQSDDTILDPSIYGFRLGFRWEIAEQFSSSLEYLLDFSRGELKLINTTRGISVDSTSILLSFDMIFGEI